jgi:DNA-binding transcriptional LysR family regulator
MQSVGKDYSEYYHIVEGMFARVSAKPRIAVECDSESSLIMEVEAGHGIALVTTILKLVITRARRGEVTPAGERFCEILRQISREADKPKRR